MFKMKCIEKGKELFICESCDKKLFSYDYCAEYQKKFKEILFNFENEADIPPQVAFEKIREIVEEHKCCICGKVYSGYGNNPIPVKNKGRCCNSCNLKVVIPANYSR